MFLLLCACFKKEYLYKRNVLQYIWCKFKQFFNILCNLFTFCHVFCYCKVVCKHGIKRTYKVPNFWLLIGHRVTLMGQKQKIMALVIEKSKRLLIKEYFISNDEGFFLGGGGWKYFKNIIVSLQATFFLDKFILMC